MRITKVKRGANGMILISYQQPRPNIEPDHLQMQCSQEPLPTFHRAMDRLNQYVAEICELGELWGKDLTVRGVTFTYKSDVMSATITAYKPLQNSGRPLVINTPLKPAEVMSDDADGGTCLSAECLDALREVMREARKYIQGERAQGSLNLGDGAEPVDPDQTSMEMDGEDEGDEDPLLEEGDDEPEEELSDDEGGDGDFEE